MHRSLFDLIIRRLTVEEVDNLKMFTSQRRGSGHSTELEPGTSWFYLSGTEHTHFYNSRLIYSFRGKLRLQKLHRSPPGGLYVQFKRYYFFIHYVTGFLPQCLRVCRMISHLSANSGVGNSFGRTNESTSPNDGDSPHTNAPQLYRDYTYISLF